MDTFTQLSETLAGFGHTLEARTRLMFGKDAAAALSGVQTGGFVVVACKGTEGTYIDEIAKLAATPEGKGKVALVDARSHDYAKVRPNVATYCKSRKLQTAITPPRKNEDGDAVGFIVRKK